MPASYTVACALTFYTLYSEAHYKYSLYFLLVFITSLLVSHYR